MTLLSFLALEVFLLGAFFVDHIGVAFLPKFPFGEVVVNRLERAFVLGILK